MARSNAKKIVGTDEVWDKRELGASMAHAELANAEEVQAVEDALSLHPISIRLPKSVIDDFKTIANIHGIRHYQSLMKEALARFADAEMRLLAREYADVIAREAKQERSHAKKVA